MSADADSWIDDLVRRLPVQGALVTGLAEIVQRTDELRALTVSCSLGRGNADEWSDVDVGITHKVADAERLEIVAAEIAAELGEPVDVRIHPHGGFGEPTRRVAAVYSNSGQLDLVLLPEAARTYHHSGEEVVVVDKDGILSQPLTVPADELARRNVELAVESAHSAWWFLGDVAKYLHRRSWFEAVERLGVARDHMLKLVAIGADARFPQFGLISVVDYAPKSLPAQLADTYALPGDPRSILSAALTLADLIDDAIRGAEHAVGQPLTSGIAHDARAKLANVEL